MNDRSALTNVKVGEDNSDPIKVHPELNIGSSPRLSVRVLATEIFPKILVVSTRMHLILSETLVKCEKPDYENAPNIHDKND